MKVLSIYNFNVNNKDKQYSHSYSFKGIDSDHDDFISLQVNDFFVHKKPSIINQNLSETMQHLKNKVAEIKSNYNKFADESNKATVLQALAEKYYKNGDIQKSAALTFEFFNNVFDNPNLSDDEKYNKIIAMNNLKIIDYYISTTPFDKQNRKFKREYNTKLMAFASETMNKVGYSEFLPFAEKLCDMKYQDLFLELSIKDYRKINTPARELINKYYDLHQLKTFLDKDQYYKDGMFNLLSKWGLPEHTYIVKDVINNGSNKKSNKLKAIETIGNIGDSTYIDLLNNFLYLDRGGWFTIDDDYNVAASLALSRLNNPKADELNKNYLEKNQNYISQYVMKDILKVICRDMDERGLPILHKILNLDKYSLSDETINYIYMALARIDNPKVKDFMINNLEKFNHRFDILSDLITCISFQKVNEIDIKKVKNCIPPHSEFPTDVSSNHGEFYIRTVNESINRLKKSFESPSLPDKESYFSYESPFAAKYPLYLDNKLNNYKHYGITEKGLNNFAANSKELEKDYEGAPIKNRKCQINDVVAEVFAKIFIKGRFNWYDVKENVR